MTIIRKKWLTILLTGNVCIAQAQSPAADSTVAKVIRLQDGTIQKTLGRLDHAYANINRKLDQQTAHYLDKLQRQEQKLKRKLEAIDSSKAKALFAGSSQCYENLQATMGNAGNKLLRLNQYVPGLDSISTAMKFLSGHTGLAQIKNLGNVAGELQNKMQAAGSIKQLLQQRAQLLHEQLAGVKLGNSFKQFNKQVYYYQQQLNEYQELLQSPDQLAEKALSLVREMPAFKDFMSKNSQLAQLFRVPGGTGNNSNALTGLQTRASVQQQINSQFGLGVNPQQFVQQQVQQAEGTLNELKNKVNQLGGGNTELSMPDFKPNSQKTKSFWQRLEYGINIQSQKTNRLLPVTSDIALTVGYKLNDKSVVGLGTAYKLGWGENISHIRVSSQGLGLRSYADIKLKGSIWISGGYEYNYQQEFKKLTQLQNLDAWQKSGLIGFSKKYKIGKKNGNLQLLWDFLSYSQVPQTQPLKFRIGYVL